MNQTVKHERFLLLLVVALAAGLRLWALDFGLPASYHADESALVRRAVAFGTGDLNPHSFHWPAFHLYLLFALYGAAFLVGRVTGAFASPHDFGALFFSDPTLFFLIGRLLSCALGTATVALVYDSARRLFGALPALLAAICLALTHYHVRDSYLAILDVPATFWMSAAFLFSVRLWQEPVPQRRHYALAGLAAGLAAATKYNGGIVVLAIVTAHLLRQPRAPFRLLVVSGLSALAAFFVTNPFILLDLPTFLRDFFFQQKHLATGQWGLGSASAWGYYVWRMLFVDLKNTERMAFDPMVLLFAGGVLALAWNRSREALLVLVVPVTYLLTIGTWGMAATRYLDPAFPGLAIAAGWWISRWDRRALPIAALALLLSLRSTAMASFILNRTDTRTEAAAWIEENIPSGSRIAIENYAPPLARSPENLARRARLLADGTFRHPTQTPERIREYYEWRARTAPPVSYDIERLNDNLLDVENVEDNRLPDTNYDLARLRQLGVQYVITASFHSDRFRTEQARVLYPRIAGFYDDLETRTRLVRTFDPGPWRPGPVLRIWALDAPAEPGAGPPTDPPR